MKTGDKLISMVSPDTAEVLGVCGKVVFIRIRVKGGWSPVQAIEEEDLYTWGWEVNK